jgi:hypothetical protein
MKWLQVIALFATTLSAQPPAGPAIGSRPPNFELRDQNGESRSLSSILGPKGAILVFYRSADW